jgi:hypothetical protein
MQSSTYASFAVGKISILPNGGPTEYLPVDHTTDFGHHVLNRATDMQAKTGEYFGVSLILASGGQASDGHCTAHGTVEVVQ